MSNPFIDQATWLQKGNVVVEPVNQTVRSSDDLYSLVYGAGFFNDIHPITAYRLYLKSDVLGMAVQKISHQISGLRLGLTTDDADFEGSSPVVQFLNSTSEGYSKRRYFLELAEMFLLTNEAWMVLRGRPDRPPVSRTWVYPFDVIDQSENVDGMPTAFRTIGDRDRRTYRRVERGGRIRWIDDREMNELVPILGSESVDRPFRGQSPLSHLLYSVQQSVEGKRHNTSMLRNGVKLTGVIMPSEKDGQFADEARKQVAAALQALRGSGTAGGTLVFPRRVDTLDLAISNRDMDYISLLRESQESVFNFYNIPLPLVSNDASTFNNYATAQTAFFDAAVFPVFDEMMDAIAAGLEPRFSELEGARITYNEHAIRALRGRNLDRMAKMRQVAALTTNEIRQAGGFDVMEDAEEVLIPSNLLPLGSDIGELPVSSTPMDIEDEPDIDDTENEDTENESDAQQEVEAVAESGNLQQTALNGAQIQALVNILSQVSAGTLTVDAARAIMAAAFPTIPSGLVEQMLEGAMQGEPERAVERVANGEPEPAED